MTSPKITRWVLFGVGIIALAGVGLSLRNWYTGYRDWHNRKFAPVVAEIEPADGMTVYGSEVWIRWAAAVPAKGRVLWREAGAYHVRAADAGQGTNFLVRLTPLEARKRYEYMVEQSGEGITQRSGVRSFDVKSGLAFDPPSEQTVEHDYDQSVKLTLRNAGKETITVTARALKQFDDLLADITGYGSVEVPAQIAPNSTLDLRLAVTAADAISPSYEIPVQAAGAYTMARVNVRIPKVNLSFRVVDEDPKTLAKTVELQNNGDTITDLAVHPVQENETDVELRPSAQHARLESGATLRLVVNPILYLEFQSLKAEIEARAAGQTTRFPFQFQAPPGMRLIAFRTASTGSSSGSDWFCTNKPNTCSDLPGPYGTGAAAAAFAKGAVAGALGSLGVNTNTGVRLAQDTRRYDHVRYKKDDESGKDPKVSLDCSGLVAQGFTDLGLPNPEEIGGVNDGGCKRMWKTLPRAAKPQIGDVVFFDIHHGQDEGGVHFPDHCGVVIWLTADDKVLIRHSTVHGGPKNEGGPREGSLDDPSGVQGKSFGAFVMGYGRPLPFPVFGLCALPPPPAQCAWGRSTP